VIGSEIRAIEKVRLSLERLIDKANLPDSYFTGLVMKQTGLALCFHCAQILFIPLIDFSSQNFSNRSKKNNRLDIPFGTQYFCAQWFCNPLVTTLVGSNETATSLNCQEHALSHGSDKGVLSTFR
jgi:hypothetical protein